MNPLLISGFGTSISVDKRKLIIHNKLEKTTTEFYPHQIDHDSVVVDGHSGSVSFEALRWLGKHHIQISLLNWNGNLLSVTLPTGPKSGKLKIAQYSAYVDDKKRLAIASNIVEQKIAQSHNLLEELAKYYSEIKIKDIDNLFAEEAANFSHGIKSVSSSMTYEGRIAIYYWTLLAKIINKLYPDFHFVNRKNKSYSWNTNASDEVNALLNYGYAILESEVRKAINSVGLEPTVGFLHELAQSKEPLVYDIQELFRWLIDLSVIQLLEEKQLKKSDFIVTENFHLRLKPSTAKLLIEKISLNFNKKVKYKHNQNFAYQNILFDIVQQLANFISEKKSNLELGIPRISLQRSDSLEIRTKILLMSPDERRRHAINKSTLWYQKRRLSSGGRFRIYAKSVSKIK